MRVQVVDPGWPHTTHIIEAESPEAASHWDPGAWHEH